MNGTATTLGVGIVGFGYWGPNHVRNLASMRSQSVIVKGIADSDPDRRVRSRDMFPEIATAESAQDLISDDAIDALVVATPAQTHYTISRQALLAGKHVLIEKPLAASVAEAEALVAKAKQCDRVLMVDHTFIYSPPVRKMKELLESGETHRGLFDQTRGVDL